MDVLISSFEVVGNMLCICTHLLRNFWLTKTSAKRRLQLMPIEYPPHLKFVT